MIAAIIQARMSSRRLPGKVLKEVLGKPLLFYLINQLRKANNVEKIIISTSENLSNDPIVEFCKKESILYYRGSENDVLRRIYDTALYFKIDNIIRITGDCPLIDPKAIDFAVDYFMKNKYDYVFLGLTFADGICCDVFSFNALKIAFEKAKLKAEREHVTPYFHNNPDVFNNFCLENKTDDSRYRIVVDKPEDFEVIKAVIEGLSKKGESPFCVEDIKKFLNENPDIYNLNKNIVRNEEYNVFEKKK